MDTFMGLPVHMDYEGQKLSEKLFQGIILLFGCIGWIYGYYVQDFFMTVLTVGAGFLLSSLITLPPWPIFRRHPLKWMPVQETSSQGSSEGTSSKKKKK